MLSKITQLRLQKKQILIQAGMRWRKNHNKDNDLCKQTGVNYQNAVK